MSVHNDAAKSVPKLIPKASPAQILAHQKALAEAVVKARPNAKPGDVFVKSVQPNFVQVITTETRGKAGRSVLAAIHGDNPGKYPALRVNSTYPDGAPLSTVPPTILLRLPKLPEELQYRFVGPDLILRDVEANLIVDYIRGVLPPAAPQNSMRRKK